MNRATMVIGILMFAAGAAIAIVWHESNRRLDTPFDHIDATKAEQYRSYYEDGRAWAHRRHTVCPPHPNPRGVYNWVAEAWVAGFMSARAEGGASPIPNRYKSMVPADVPLQWIWLAE